MQTAAGWFWNLLVIIIGINITYNIPWWYFLPRCTAFHQQYIMFRFNWFISFCSNLLCWRITHRIAHISYSIYNYSSVLNISSIRCSIYYEMWKYDIDSNTFSTAFEFFRNFIYIFFDIVAGVIIAFQISSSNTNNFMLLYFVNTTHNSGDSSVAHRFCTQKKILNGARVLHCNHHVQQYTVRMHKYTLYQIPSNKSLFSSWKLINYDK